MKFLKVSDTKLKIVMSRDDCLKYNIDTSASDFSTSEVRTAIRTLLAIANGECGFSAEGERILAQLYPMPEGGCELFITKLAGVSKQTREAVRDIEGLSTVEHRRGVYCFADSASILGAVRAIYKKGIDCDLYLSDEGLYYISISESITDDISEFEILTEYGDRLKTLPLYAISEYGTLLCKKHALDYILHKTQS